MELIIPLIVSIAAFGLLIAGMAFKHVYESSELFLFAMILSTIFFFLGGIMFIDVSYISPATGLIVTIQTYNFLVWLMVPFGFIPILLMYLDSMENLDGKGD